MEFIKITGAREHNLQDVSLSIPRGKLVVITGVSGSGKSSLAFDTIFAEGQRRYMESLSAYARQFVEKIDKPDVDSIEGLSPSISVDQKTFQRNPRSTVGTITEIYDFLRLLFARIGKPYCYKCGVEISAQSLDKMVERVSSLGKGEKISIYSPIVQGRKGEYRKELEELRSEGYLRVRINGDIYDLDEEVSINKNKKHTIELLVDVAVIRSENMAERIRESLQIALKRSGGVAVVESEKGEQFTFSDKFACPQCGMSYPEISPRLFSFNSPYGSCKACHGIGTNSFCDPELLIDPDLSISDGAIIPWRNSSYFKQIIDNVSEYYGFSLTTPFNKLPAKIKKIIVYGSGDEEVMFYKERKGRVLKYWETYSGVLGITSQWFKETESPEIREKLSQYMRTSTCTVCDGSRLRKEALSIFVEDKSIYDFAMMPVENALEFFTNLKLKGRDEVIGERVIKEIKSRLRFLDDVGLSYLSLDRSAPTLSGGEAQRIRLATQVGSKLTGITYVLDEPTIGLHSRDNLRLIETLKSLRDSGNSIIVVEHDEETIRNADFVVDIGPGAGEKGGEIVSAGGVVNLTQNKSSLTGGYLSGGLEIVLPKSRRKPKGHISIKGAVEHNLKNIDVDFPLGVFTCVTGVSGSGKSTLVIDTLYNALSRSIYNSKELIGKHKKINGFKNIDKVLNVEQSPIGRTPRSNPATYTGLFSPIRDLFSMLPQANARGYKPGRFSFNVSDGRCSVCGGHGTEKIEMHFLPDVYVTCERCGGSRYNSETLEIKYNGKSIADVLDMTVSEAHKFFKNVPNLKSKLEVLEAVGLEYIRLGQAATTLSGGEAQRIKLSKELSRRDTGNTIYILDEPTIGLHFDDVRKLLLVIQELTNKGNTVIVIEHNLDVIKCADHLIDMGPEGGEAGGQIVAQGTPEKVSKVKGSYTGMFLKKILANKKSSKGSH
ncbi:MAG: UvrABC system protein A [Thermodesulfobacteriota bacterium]|nr:MAG: UvrABC system protein A [Thermodesulfobacteriota bacterium]